MAFDVIVVGAGVMGLSAANELASRGQRVLVFDQFDIPNSLGSSHGDTRVIRTAYFEHPDYVPLAKRAWRKWEELGKSHNAEIIVKTGGLYIGPSDSPLIAGSIEAAERHGLSYSLGNEEATVARSRIRVPEGFVTFWEEDCGIVMAARAINALTSACREAGVELRAKAAITGWSASSRGVMVAVGAERFEAGRLVICAGPWASSLLGRMAIPLVVTRQIVAFTEPEEQNSYAAGTFPVTCAQTTDGAFYYTVPICHSEGIHNRHFKVGRHNPIDVVDPDNVNRTPTESDSELALAGLRNFIPGAAEPLHSLEVCLYTNTPDAHFVIDKHPEHDNVFIACGFSGHGFKFAPVVGEALADLATIGSTKLTIDFLGASRFNR